MVALETLNHRRLEKMYSHPRPSERLGRGHWVSHGTEESYKPTSCDPQKGQNQALLETHLACPGSGWRSLPKPAPPTLQPLTPLGGACGSSVGDNGGNGSGRI